MLYSIKVLAVFLAALMTISIILGLSATTVEGSNYDYQTRERHSTVLVTQALGDPALVQAPPVVTESVEDSRIAALEKRIEAQRVLGVALLIGSLFAFMWIMFEGK